MYKGIWKKATWKCTYLSTYLTFNAPSQHNNCFQSHIQLLLIVSIIIGTLLQTFINPYYETSQYLIRLISLCRLFLSVEKLCAVSICSYGLPGAFERRLNSKVCKRQQITIQDHPYHVPSNYLKYMHREIFDFNIHYICICRFISLSISFFNLTISVCQFPCFFESCFIVFQIA